MILLYIESSEVRRDNFLSYKVSKISLCNLTFLLNVNWLVCCCCRFSFKLRAQINTCLHKCAVFYSKIRSYSCFVVSTLSLVMIPEQHNVSHIISFVLDDGSFLSMFSASYYKYSIAHKCLLF